MPRTRKFFTRIHVWRGKVIHIGGGYDGLLSDALSADMNNFETGISLCSSVRRFRDATIKEECKGDYPHALQPLWKALDRAEDLIQD